MSDWRHDLLHTLKAPVTGQNLLFLDAWARSEGTAASHNPLATTQPAPGAWLLGGNPSGVKQYPNDRVGVAATAQTLLNGRYPSLVRLLRSGRATAAQLAAQRGELATWGTGDLVARVLGSKPGTAMPVAARATTAKPQRTAPPPAQVTAPPIAPLQTHTAMRLPDPNLVVGFMEALNSSIGRHSSLLPALQAAGGLIQSERALASSPAPAAVSAPAQAPTAAPVAAPRATAPAVKAARAVPAKQVTGLRPSFQHGLSALIAAVDAHGGTLTVSSGFRPVAEQQRLWSAALRKYGSAAAARKWVAPPGRSNHNKGLAADLRGSLDLAHQLAPQYGLTFPMSWEPWHIEPVGLRA